MMTYQVLKQLHVLTVAISISLFVLRFFWLWRGGEIIHRRWVKIVPHVNDTLLFLTGVALLVLGRFYPLLGRDTWLTEKLFGVIIYILLGYLALNSRTPSRCRRLRILAFVLALGCLYLIIKLATTKIPFLMGYL
ncbi:siroheme synthase [Serratia sp. S1B]|nr:siroheme synthase [Serratia sp. S1B]